jgi:hypothetical protein
VKRLECACGLRVFFENTKCFGCGRFLGFVPEALTMSRLEPVGASLFETSAGRRVKRCRNATDHGNCNWVLPVDDPSSLCRSCGANRTIPDITIADNLLLWTKVEQAKRRLLYTLLDLRLLSSSGGRGDWPTFEFLEDRRRNPNVAEDFVATGHLGGVITLNLSEADDVAREAQREEFVERYRTVLGHLRHEAGHFVFPRLTSGPDDLDAVRRLFGDERQEYGAALSRHYQNGPPTNWAERHISPYASVHPREDFAETFAHYLLIVDALETAGASGLGSIGEGLPWIRRWIEIAIALNELSRSLGSGDAYPFTLTPPVIEKLELVARLVSGFSRPPAP